MARKTYKECQSQSPTHPFPTTLIPTGTKDTQQTHNLHLPFPQPQPANNTLPPPHLLLPLPPTPPHINAHHKPHPRIRLPPKHRQPLIHILQQSIVGAQTLSIQRICTRARFENIQRRGEQERGLQRREEGLWEAAWGLGGGGGEDGYVEGVVL